MEFFRLGRKWESVLLVLAGVVVCFPLSASTVSSFSSASPDSDLSISTGTTMVFNSAGATNFVSAQVLTGNLDRWYSPVYLPSSSAGTPQEILLANMLDSAQPSSGVSGTGLAGYSAEYIAQLEAEIVSGWQTWYAPVSNSVLNVVQPISIASSAAPESLSRVVPAVPEPGTLVLLGGGFVALGVMLANRAGRGIEERAEECGGNVWPHI